MTIRSAVAAAPSLQLSPLLPVVVDVFVKSVIEVRWRRIRMRERRRRERRERSVMDRESPTVSKIHTHTDEGGCSHTHAPSIHNKIFRKETYL